MLAAHLITCSLQWCYVAEKTEQVVLDLNQDFTTITSQSSVPKVIDN